MRVCVCVGVLHCYMILLICHMDDHSQGLSQVESRQRLLGHWSGHYRVARGKLGVAS